MTIEQWATKYGATITKLPRGKLKLKLEPWPLVAPMDDLFYLDDYKVKNFGGVVVNMQPRKGVVIHA